MAGKVLCRRCGKRFSDDVEKCPFCGRPNLVTTPCKRCGIEIALVLEQCPHCGHTFFPNVAMAEDPRERQALARRYEKAVRDARKRGAEQIVGELEAATAASVAVIARSLEDTIRLARGDNESYATFYQLGRAQVRSPRGEKWDRLRGLADEALFGPYREKVRFASLSLDGAGLESYGEIAWILRAEMIAERASVFEENSGTLMRRWSYEPKPGYRATWMERSKLCVAKLAGRIDKTTDPAEFPGILVRQGPTPEEDDFVEVHVGGPITVRTMERLRVMTPEEEERKDIAEALMEVLRKADPANPLNLTVES